MDKEIIADFTTRALDYVQTNFASAIIILLVGFIISYLLGRIIRKILKEIELDNITYKTFGFKLKLEKRISKLVTYIFYIITVVIALTKLLIGYYLLVGVAIIVGVILVISLLLTIYDFVPNFISGIIIRKKKLKVGDNYSFKNTIGRIKKITPTNLILETPDKDFVYIPNRAIRKNLRSTTIKS